MRAALGVPLLAGADKGADKPNGKGKSKDAKEVKDVKDSKEAKDKVE